VADGPDRNARNSISAIRRSGSDTESTRVAWQTLHTVATIATEETSDETGADQRSPSDHLDDPFPYTHQIEAVTGVRTG
jgi:hypothetical protein